METVLDLLQIDLYLKRSIRNFKKLSYERLNMKDIFIISFLINRPEDEAAGRDGVAREACKTFLLKPQGILSFLLIILRLQFICLPLYF